MMPAVPERRSFGYVRHGTIDLFAALNTATGKVISKLSASTGQWTSATSPTIDRQTDPAWPST